MAIPLVSTTPLSVGESRSLCHQQDTERSPGNTMPRLFRCHASFRVTSLATRLRCRRWMSCPACWVVHKRAFVALGHKPLPSACLGMGHKGIVQYAPVGGRMSRVKHYWCSCGRCPPSSILDSSHPVPCPAAGLQRRAELLTSRESKGYVADFRDDPEGWSHLGAEGTHPQLRNGH